MTMTGFVRLLETIPEPSLLESWDAAVGERYTGPDLLEVNARQL